MNPVFTGSITQGKLRLDAPARYMVHLGDSGEYAATIERKRKKVKIK